MNEEIKKSKLHTSVSPHIRDSNSIPLIMLTVIISLIPPAIASIVFFHIKALVLMSICISTSVMTEYLIVRFIFKKPNTIHDLSAIVTGILVAFCLPPNLPWWIASIGAFFAIAVVKMPFGGLGNNILNPALTARAFLLICYPTEMTSFCATRFGSINGINSALDGVTNATPLTFIKTTGDQNPLFFLHYQSALPDLFVGNVGGSLGETSVLALIIGIIFLYYKRLIGFSSPIAFVSTTFFLFWLFQDSSIDLLTFESLVIPTYHILSGGLMLGAFFMASDMVTTPLTSKGRIVFGFGCGLLTFIIRKYGQYPEGVCYAILFMNLMLPFIDRFCINRVFGYSK